MTDDSPKQDKRNQENPDMFIREYIYPETAQIFSFKPKALQEIKNDCVFVIDTSSLLVPYKTGKDSLEQIRQTFKLLAREKRLFIPSQVAREFADNRPRMLAEIYQQFSSKGKISNLRKGEYPILEGHEHLLAILQLEDEINEKISEYKKTVKKVLDHIKTWNWDDPVSLIYNEIFADDIVVDLSSKKEAVINEFKKRQLHNIPPGYKDTSKHDKGVGDLIIWLTILQIGKMTKKSLVFVSGEEKTDWWVKSEKQLLYPRFELVDEYRRASGGNSFHILKFSNFLELFGADSKVINEVRKEEQDLLLDEIADDALATINFNLVQDAVFDWLLESFKGAEIIHEPISPSMFIDGILALPSGDRIGVEIKYMPQNTYFTSSSIVRIIYQHAPDYLSKYDLTSFVLFAVYGSKRLIQSAELSGMFEIYKTMTDDVNYFEIQLGYLNDNLEFIPYP
jgi:hypothetical protein